MPFLLAPSSGLLSSQKRSLKVRADFSPQSLGWKVRHDFQAFEAGGAFVFWAQPTSAASDVDPDIGYYVDRETSAVAVGRVRLDRVPDGRPRRGIQALRFLTQRLAVLGLSFLDELSGDFSFAIATSSDRIVWGRDPLGSCSIFHSTFATGPLISDSIESLAAVRSRVDPDVTSIKRYLYSDYSTHGHTFIRGLSSVPQGTLFEWRDGTYRQRRYYDPSVCEEPGEENGRVAAREGFRSLFLSAVARRVDGYPAVAIRLSGGLDSSSIACAASRHTQSHPRRLAISARFPGLSCDESQYIDSVAKRLCFPVETFDGTSAEDESFTNPSLSGPDVSASFVGGTTELQIAAAYGASRLLCGGGGDVLGQGRYVFQDALRSRDLISLAKLCYAVPPNRREARCRLALSSVGGLLRRPLPSRKPLVFMRPEPWLRFGPAALRSCDGYQSSSQTMKNTLLSPGQAWIQDIKSQYIVGTRLAFCYPFLDRDLVDFVLSLPWRARLPLPMFRSLHREALRGIVPNNVLNRATKATFEEVRFLRLQRNRGLAEDLFDRSQLSSDFIDAQAFKRSLDECLRAGPQHTPVRVIGGLYAAICLEAWMRAVSGYNAIHARLR